MGASVNYVSSQLVFATISGLLILVATFLLSLHCQTRRSKGFRVVDLLSIVCVDQS